MGFKTEVNKKLTVPLKTPFYVIKIIFISDAAKMLKMGQTQPESEALLMC